MSNDNVIFLSNVRLSFPHLVEPQRNTNAQTGQERVSYNAEFIMPQDHPGFAQFMSKYGELALAKWGEHANNVMQMVLQDRKKRCFGNGDEKVNQKTFQVYDGYANNVFITAGRDSQPQIIQDDGSAIDPTNSMAYQQIARRMYGGCRVNVAIKPWLQDNTHGRGVRCDLVAIQFAGDDAAFGEGSVDASGMFGAVQGQPAGAAAPTAAPAGMPAGIPANTAPAPAAQPAAAAPAMGMPPFMQG